MYIIKSRLFLIGAIISIIAGASGLPFSDDGMMMGFSIALIVFGVLLLISGFLTPAVSESATGRGLGLFMMLGAILFMIGAALMNSEMWDYGPMAFVGGGIIVFIVVLAWPCVCCQGTKGARSQVIGVASAHESITISELSQRAGVTEKHARDIVYDAIGKRQLIGKMEGDTFVKSAAATPSYTAPTSTTKEREVVKVLVICPYCGAKTEQGIGKCQNCQADL